MGRLIVNNLPPIGTLTNSMGGATLTTFQALPIVNPLRPLVRYVERDGSPRFRFADNQTDCVREFIVGWDQFTTAGTGYFDAILDLIGFPMVVGSGSTAYIRRYTPWFFPLLSPATQFRPASPFLYCTHANVDPLTMARDLVTVDGNGVHRYENALVTATFESLPYKILDDQTMVNSGYVDGNGNPDESWLARYVSRHPGPTARYQTLPKGSLIYVSDSSVVPSSPGVLEMECDLMITHHHVPEEAVGLRLINPFIADKAPGSTDDYVPPLEKLLGRVNLTDFAGCKKGTLLLGAAVLKPIESLIGLRLYDIDYRFRWFGRKSAVLYSNPGNTDYAYGHNMLLRIDAVGPNGTVIGYDEVVGQKAAGSPQSGTQATSNYLQPTPSDGINPLNYGEMADLFRVPVLG